MTCTTSRRDVVDDVQCVISARPQRPDADKREVAVEASGEQRCLPRDAERDVRTVNTYNKCATPPALRLHMAGDPRRDDQDRARRVGGEPIGDASQQCIGTCAATPSSNHEQHRRPFLGDRCQSPARVAMAENVGTRRVDACRVAPARELLTAILIQVATVWRIEDVNKVKVGGDRLRKTGSDTHKVDVEHGSVDAADDGGARKIHDDIIGATGAASHGH
jgi:hypothetical protein